MAKRTTHNPLPETPTKLIVGKEFFKEQLTARIKLGEEILSRQIQTYEQLEKSKADYYQWNDYNSEFLKQSFNKENNEYRETYDSVNTFAFVLGGRQDELKEFREDVESKIENLKQLVAKTDLLKTDVEEKQLRTEISSAPGTLSQDVFVVHGHNNEIKIDVARTLEKLGLNPIILHEQPNNGKTIIEKFETYSNVGFAIVLLTDDDEGKSKKETDLKLRARQNVILELGYFIGRLGRDKVCPLYSKGVELPTDISGVLYIEIDPGDTWKIRMVKELKAAGYDVDANKIL
jgi:predicted nucleotide-binding protein